jgi:hypothetical protein
MNLEIEHLRLPQQAEVKVELSVTATINITDIVAQRRVSKLLLDQVGNLLYGEHPHLVVGRRLVWRVPVHLGLPGVGPLGEVGTLDVDVQTGEILFTEDRLKELAERGDVMATRATSTTK